MIIDSAYRESLNLALIIASPHSYEHVVSLLINAGADVVAIRPVWIREKQPSFYCSKLARMIMHRRMVHVDPFTLLSC